MKKILLLLAMSLLPMITMADAVEIDGRLPMPLKRRRSKLSTFSYFVCTQNQ